MDGRVILNCDWSDPARVLAALAGLDHAAGLISDGTGARGRWSYVVAEPDAVLTVAPDDPRDPFAALSELIGPLDLEAASTAPDLPPFQGGVLGLASYELGARVEALNLPRSAGWPDLACARYRSLLAFDHHRRALFAIGRGPDAEAAARKAAGWLGRPAPLPATGPLADRFDETASGAAYEAAVAEVIDKITAGEIFQANVARPWQGRLVSGVQPIDLLQRLVGDSPAPFAGYLRLPGRAVVSNSPERFISVAAGRPRRAETRPIKGTRPRGGDVTHDAALAQALSDSAKDRAENLMIVDLMRNDLARVCTPGTVRTPDLFRVETYANVHHLVSTVTGDLIEGTGAGELLRATYPPGSITGAPKVQAMTVIRGLEPARGPYCGALFWAGFDGAFDSSVLIRTVALVQDAEGWSFEARAGAGIVADSDPVSERRETEDKMAAIRAAMMGPALGARP
jgi:para-aminobenzoate synthetase component 1